jgi:predicted alpha/beta hydrolase family esterase
LKNKNKVPLPLRIIPVVFPWVERLTPFLANRFFITLFFTPIRYKTPEKELAAKATAKKFVVTANQKKVQVYSWGTGPVVLMVHGWAGRGTQFRKFIEPLNKAGYRVVAMDGPAHGESEGRQTNLDEFKAAIEAVLKQVGNAEAIIAHSFGGIAALYSIASGLPVHRLVNIASPTIADEIIKTYLRAINGSPKTGEAFKQYVVKKTGNSFKTYSALEFIRHVPPCLALMLVHDEEDREVIIDHPKALMKLFPTAKLLQTKGLGHTRILKDEGVIHQIVTFLGTPSSQP